MTKSLKFQNKSEKIIFLLLCGYALVAGISLSMANLALDVAMIIAISQWLLARKVHFPERTIVSLILLYLVVLVFSAIGAQNLSLTFEPIWRSFYYLVIPFYLSWRYLDSAKKKFLCMFFLMISISISGSYSIWLSFNGVTRAAGFLPILETATLAAQCSFFLLPFLYHESLQSSQNGQRNSRVFWIGLVMCGVLFTVVLATNNRQTWFSYMATLFVLLIMLKFSWRKWCVVVLVFLVLTGGMMFLSPAAGSRLLNIHDGSANERFVMWRDAIAHFQDHPLFGIGPGNSREYISINQVKTHNHPHSTPLQLLAETGMMGFLAYSLLYGYLINSFYHQYVRANCCWSLSALLVLLVTQFCGLTEDYLFGVVAARQLEWFIIGLAWRNKVELTV